MTKNTKLVIGSTGVIALAGWWLTVTAYQGTPLAWVLAGATLAFLIFTVFVWARPAEKPADQLAKFISQGRELQARCKTEGQELVVPALNKWVARVEKFLARHLGQSYVVLFGDFSGLTQFVDPRKQSPAETMINYRVMRLTQFIQEQHGSES